MTFRVGFFCALAVFVQVITCQYLGNPLNAGLNFNGLPVGANFANGLAGPGLAGLAGAGCGAGVASGTFAVTSTSPIAPTGVSVLAENLAIEGPLQVGGQLPFLGTVGLEGALPAIGSGAVSYGCGNGNVGIISEGSAGPGIPGPYGLAAQALNPGLNGLGSANPAYGLGLPGGSFGSGLVGQGYGPGLAGVGVGFGNGLPGPAFGNSLNSLLATGAGQSLASNGVGGVSGAVVQ